MADHKTSIEMMEKLNKYLQDSITKENELSNLQEIHANKLKVLNELKRDSANLTADEQQKLQDIERTISDEAVQLRKKTDEQRKYNKALEQEIKNRQRSVDFAKQLAGQLKIGWTYLQQSDKVIRNTVLNLGLSGQKAAQMRTAFEQSAGFVTRLGGTLEDIQKVMEGYADETGRARVMSAEMVKDITAIGKGTGVGIEQATRLGAQFELMGLDAKSTMEYVQGVVDTSERMGVNTTKVLKNINDNFKRLNTYTFQQGVKGFAQMASYAEKFKIDINQALNAADVAKSLEGAVDLAAQLQVMGGEFAKTDPFEMLFLSRNDPAKFTEKIADMTKGVVTFRKMADGSFQKFISPADRDRLAAVAKSMGMEASALTEITERQAEIQKMRQEMAGMGLSDEQKKLIEGAAIFDTKSGKFQVQLAGTMKDISTLTKDQADSFVKQQSSLEERAKQALTFDETFKATIETLKSALLPILRGVNVILKPLSKVADWFSQIAGSHLGWLKAGGILLAGAAAWKGAATLFNIGVEKYVKGGLGDILRRKAGVGGGGNGGAGGAGAAGSPSPWFTKTGAIRKGAPEMIKAQGMKSLATGAGVGVAAAGIGAAVGGAAVGIAKLADSMSKLTDKQAETLQKIATTLAIAFPAAALGVGILAAVAAPAAVPLLALGGAMLMIGGAVGIAAAGIGYMGKGLGEMFKNVKGSGDDFLKIASGIGMMSVSLAGAGVTLPAAIGLAFAIGRIAKHADAIADVGEAFKNIKTVMSGSKDDFIAVENAVKSISGMNTKGGGMLGELANLLKSPLKVEFANDKVALVNDITLNLDGQKFMNKTFDAKLAIQKHEALRHGKGS